MASPKYIARRMKELSNEDLKLTPKRIKTLRNILNTIKGVFEINIRIDDDNPIIEREDYEDVGQMDYLLSQFFPDGNVPIELEPYMDFVKRIRNINYYHSVLEAKLQRDSEYLSRKDKNIDELDDPVYQRLFFSVIDSDKTYPERSKILIKYEREQLYEENIPDFIFQGLPEGSTIIFDYTDQGLNINLKETLENCKKTSDISKVEKIILESLAQDHQSKLYIDSIYDQINKELNQ